MFWNIKELAEEQKDSCFDEADDLEGSTPITDFVKKFLNIIFTVGSIVVVLFLCFQLCGFCFV